VRLDEKARENLDAAARLLPRDEADWVEPLPNAAASRAYYAAYLAVADAAQRAGHDLTSSAHDYYRHDSLAADARRWGILDGDDDVDALSLLHGRRIKADYYEDQVDLVEANEAVEIATSLVRRLLSVQGSA
jgi:hypothetical protein